MKFRNQGECLLVRFRLIKSGPGAQSHFMSMAMTPKARTRNPFTNQRAGRRSAMQDRVPLQSPLLIAKRAIGTELTRVSAALWRIASGA